MPAPSLRTLHRITASRPGEAVLGAVTLATVRSAAGPTVRVVWPIVAVTLLASSAPSNTVSSRSVTIKKCTGPVRAPVRSKLPVTV